MRIENLRRYFKSAHLINRKLSSMKLKIREIQHCGILIKIILIIVKYALCKASKTNGLADKRSKNGEING